MGVIPDGPFLFGGLNVISKLSTSDLPEHES
jgi:hypothetical protein